MRILSSNVFKSHCYSTFYFINMTPYIKIWIGKSTSSQMTLRLYQVGLKVGLKGKFAQKENEKIS